MLAAVDEMLIDLVRDRQRVELLAETGDERQLVPGVDLPGRVVWGVDDDRPGAGIEGPAQLVTVKVPIRWHQRYHHRRGAGQDAVGPVVLVEGLEDDDLIARVDEREDGRQHRFRYPAADGDLGLRIDGHPPEMATLVGDGVAHHLRAPGGRVLIEIL